MCAVRVPVLCGITSCILDLCRLLELYACSMMVVPLPLIVIITYTDFVIHEYKCVALSSFRFSGMLNICE